MIAIVIGIVIVIVIDSHSDSHSTGAGEEALLQRQPLRYVLLQHREDWPVCPPIGRSLHAPVWGVRWAGGQVGLDEKGGTAEERVKWAGEGGRRGSRGREGRGGGERARREAGKGGREGEGGTGRQADRQTDRQKKSGRRTY